MLRVIFIILLCITCRKLIASTISENKPTYLVGSWNALYNSLSVNQNKDIAGTEDITVEQSEEHLNTLCYGCQRHSHGAKITITEIDLTELRIEYIKKQILEKLRLKKPPVSVVPLSKLPQPVSEGDEVVPRSDSGRKIEPDDFYGKTTQAILFPIEDVGECMPVGRSPSACFQFQFPNDIEFQDVSAAELWVYKVKDPFDSHNQTFVVTEIAHWDTKHSFPKMKPIAIHETNTEEGWLRIDLAWPVRDWLKFSELKHSLNVACKTCGMDQDNSPVSQASKYKPFLVIYTYSSRQRTNTISSKYQKRKKRYLNCEPGNKECCREELYISFKALGWDDWIIHPSGYHAYFCRGSCNSAAAVTLSGSHYSSVIRKLVNQGASPSLRLEFQPCCTSARFLPLQLLYMDNNNTITQKSLPNMIVESCGCM